MKRKLTVVIFQREGNEWVAQCLEWDIGAQAGSLPDLVYELQRVLVGHVIIARQHDLEPFECLPSTPTLYRDKLEAREPVVISSPLAKDDMWRGIPASDSLANIDPHYLVTA